MLKFKLEATSISSTVHIRRSDNVGDRHCWFNQVAETIGLLKTMDLVNFGGLRGFHGFRFLDPPLRTFVRWKVSQQQTSRDDDSNRSLMASMLWSLSATWSGVSLRTVWNQHADRPAA